MPAIVADATGPRDGPTSQTFRDKISALCYTIDLYRDCLFMTDSEHQALTIGSSRDPLLRLVADSVPALIAYFEVPTLQCLFANRRYAEYNGWTPETTLGKSVREAIGESAWKVIGPHVDAVVDGKTVKYVREQILPSGEQRMIEVNLIPHFDDAQIQIGIFVLINDITDQWRAEQAIRDSAERMRKMAEATNEGIMFHSNGVINDTNEALQRLLGYSLDELVGRQLLEFIPEVWRQTVSDYVKTGREDPYETAVIHKDGHEIPVEIVGKTMPFAGGSYRLAVVRDICARKEAQQRIEFMALHDTLTQLPNRFYLRERLDSILALARRRQGLVAILFIDLDDFKAVNDSLGHHAGDVLLCEIARRLKAAVREADVVSRLGGDEFLIVLTEIASPHNAAIVATNLIEAINSAVAIDGHQVSVSPSIGISVFPQDGDTADDLIRHADAAMYHAKDSGCGNYQFFLPDRTRTKG
jgi:diguanylate cyclase (GGDEF)-like protein/PAS domain S-box-containing protein